MKLLNKSLLLAAFSLASVVTSEATAQRKKPIGAMRAKPSVLVMPELSTAEKALVPAKKSKVATTDPCALLTLAAIQHAIDEIEDGLAASHENLSAHSPAEYAVAGEYAIVYFKDALAKMVALQTWLADNHLDSPFVSNVSAAYTVHWYARDAAGILAYAEHWATISAVYNMSTEARRAAEHGIRATELLGEVGASGLRCYTQAYFP